MNLPMTDTHLMASFPGQPG